MVGRLLAVVLVVVAVPVTVAVTTVTVMMVVVVVVLAVMGLHCSSRCGIRSSESAVSWGRGSRRGSSSIGWRGSRRRGSRSDITSVIFLQVHSEHTGIEILQVTFS